MNYGEMQPLGSAGEKIIFAFLAIVAIATIIGRIVKSRELSEFIKHSERDGRFPSAALKGYVERTSTLPASVTYVAHAPVYQQKQAIEAEVLEEGHSQYMHLPKKEGETTELTGAAKTTISNGIPVRSKTAHPSLREMMIAKEILSEPVSRRPKNRYGAIR